MELIHEDTSDDRHDVAAILQEQFEISAEQAPLDVRLQVRPSSPQVGPLITAVQLSLLVQSEAVMRPHCLTLRSE